MLRAAAAAARVGGGRRLARLSPISTPAGRLTLAPAELEALTKPANPCPFRPHDMVQQALPHGCKAKLPKSLS